jgi:hypothetical protein
LIDSARSDATVPASNNVAPPIATKILDKSRMSLPFA